MAMDFSWLPEGQDVSRLPLGMRVNNPGNIKYNPRLGYAGMLGPSSHTDQGDPQMTFDNPLNGMTAAARLARVKYNRGQRTAASIVAGSGGWTPGNTAAAANIARTMGVGPDEDLRLEDPAQMAKFLRALTRQEHGNASSLYSDDLITQAAGAPAGPISTEQGAAMPQMNIAAPGTQGGVMPAAAPAANPALDRLKALLYDPTKAGLADELLAGGEATAKGARNWIDALNSGLQTGLGVYEKKFGEGAKKAEYEKAFRSEMANASDAAGLARLLMASPDPATAMKGAEMFAQLEMKKASGAGSEDFNKNMTLGVNKKTGKIEAVTSSNKGTVKRLELPEDFELSEKLHQVDTATGTRMIGGTTHGPVGADVPKNLADAEAEKKRGEALQVAKGALPGVETQTRRLLDTIEKLDKHEARQRFTGYTGYLPTLRTTSNDYEALQKQVQGGTFLQGFGDLRGGGAITEIEGLKAEAALTRLAQVAPSDEGYQAALDDARRTFKEIRNNARVRAGLEPLPDDEPIGGGKMPLGEFKVKAVR